MGNRRFEMYEYRQVLVRMRLGDTDRALARAGLMGRRKAAELRAVAAAEGWLDRESPLPDEAALAERVRRPSTRPSTTSAVEPYREEVLRLWGQKIQGTTIHDFLVRCHGFAGSYSSLRRFLQAHVERHPRATMMLDFEMKWVAPLTRSVVAPAGAWIETVKCSSSPNDVPVVAPAGEWIERSEERTGGRPRSLSPLL